MSSKRIICSVVLDDTHRSTAKTIHLLGHNFLPAPKQLTIVQLGEDPGYYLLYLDGKGMEMTDTYHETQQAAMEQAEFEFGVCANDWHTPIG